MTVKGDDKLWLLYKFHKDYSSHWVVEGMHQLNNLRSELKWDWEKEILYLPIERKIKHITKNPSKWFGLPKLNTRGCFTVVFVIATSRNLNFTILSEL